MKTPKEVATKAVERELGEAHDNLARAQMSFGGMTAEGLGQQYGASGRTHQQILDGYGARVAESQAALEWMEAQPDA